MNYFEKRKALRTDIKNKILSLEQEREKSLQGLNDTEIKEKKKEFRAEDKKIKKEMKENYKKQSGKEKRHAKKEYKAYQKFKNRKSRFIRNSFVLVLVAVLLVQAVPYLGNAINVFSSKHLTIDTESKEAIVAREQGEMISEMIADEGIVLLKNEDNSLPLKDNKINVFGVSAHHIRYGGGGSGSSDTSRAVDLFTALENQGINYNPSLKEFYESEAEKIRKDSNNGLGQVIQGFLGMNVVDEPEISHLNDEVIHEAQAYSQQALIVISSSGTEASDFEPDQLKLTENKRKLVEKVSENFDDVTIIVNAGNTLELGFIEAYDSIKSVLWVGTPGPYGMNSLARVLTGEINPSGRLVDTYAYDTSSAPASVNFGDYQYDNLDKAWIAYEEGIYVGYRYYETFYEDEQAYQKVVQYPFGYGLSYTDFSWEITGQDIKKDMIQMKVKVSNTGEKLGKDVVQVYYSAPYTEGGLEKSAINLANYKKTDALIPNSSQELEIQFPIKDMASYDTEQSAYVLEKGTYKIHLGKNVHEIVETIDYTVPETIIYKTDPKTDTVYENRFEDAKGDFKYLSRSDKENTFPQEHDRKTSAPQSLIDAIKNDETPQDIEQAVFEQNNNLKFSDLVGLDYDSSKWQSYIEQWSVEELMNFVVYGAYHTEGNERLGLKPSVLMDGPAGFSYFFGDVKAAAYPTEVVVSSTWNDDLAYQYGEAVGKEAKAYGIQGWYAPAMNLHRSAKGGRNFEYFSEDPIVSGKMSAAITRGAQSQDIIVFMKHFALNDQETNARSGIVVWADEQAIRELYLKPFEITVKEGNATGAMSSFSFIGPTWAGAHDGLLNKILREEWGFEGVVSTDAVFGFMHADEAIVNGNDLMLDIILPHNNYKRLEKAYKKNPNYIGRGLQKSAHNILYALSKTDLE